MQFSAPSLVCFLLLFSAFSEARSVAETVQLSIVRHPEFQIGQLDVKRQSLALEKLEASFLPHVSVSAGIGREDSNNTSTRARIGGSEEMERRESAVTIRQMLFDGFDTHWRQQGQTHRADAARKERDSLALQVALQAIEVHLDTLEALRKLDFNMENFQTHERIAEGIRVRVRSGKDDRAKVAQVEARLSLSLANLETAKSGLLQSQARYRELAGEMSISLLKDPETLPAFSGSLDETLQRVLENHPQLAASALYVKAAEQQSKASQSYRYPDLYLDAGASWNDNLDGVTGRNSDAYAMLRVQYDLYRGGSNTTERKQARLARERSKLELDLLQRELMSEAEQVWFAMRSAQKQVDFLEDYIASAEITKAAYQKQFDIGQRSLIDLLDAENELLAAREKWLEAKRNYHWLVFRLSALEGGLLDHLTLRVPDTV
ncbi:MAG: hypothetical protein C9356_05030 [Oleiphilus sp.]|nr:MAG: hypothetical protein C9356_05030 [Oleiphilus sp.]